MLSSLSIYFNQKNYFWKPIIKTNNNEKNPFFTSSSVTF